MIIHYIGLGKMGKNMVLRLLEEGHEIHAWNRSPEPRIEVESAGATVYETIEDLFRKKDTGNAESDLLPRIVWLMLPAGEVTQQMVTRLCTLLAPGDIVIDGANGFYKDAHIYAQLLKKYHINYIDVAVSGGPSGARNGAVISINRS